MTGRSVPLWVGSSPDAAIPRSVQLRIWAKYEGRCALSGRKLGPGEGEIDHILPLGLGGRHAEDNLQLIAKDKHREKTAGDVRQMRKADRVRAKHLGIWPESKAKIKSRGFEKTRPQPSQRGGEG